MVRPSLIAIGASAGGIQAVKQILEKISPELTVPVVVVQHMAPQATIDVSLIYETEGRKALEARDKMPVEERHVYFAPPDYHLLLEKDLTFALSQDGAVHFARPSIDVFFESVAETLGTAAVGVILTGANGDGAEGLLAISQAGGITIVQDPQTAEIDFMPRSALEKLRPHYVLGLDDIAQKLGQWAHD